MVTEKKVSPAWIRSLIGTIVAVKTVSRSLTGCLVAVTPKFIFLRVFIHGRFVIIRIPRRKIIRIFRFPCGLLK
ncbi:hypothetical protein C8J48_2519 [Desmospora activa DSM 45169]|uniref:Uncharacterized protein n=1 Tax=Desmospora activa DSM 45169 TaxID=1121389 RepID=A0A2T4ZDD8_9BACL|nr:hypothetical protein C8J48_2519 [Desmospora activa DSM 45169]